MSRNLLKNIFWIVQKKVCIFAARKVFTKIKFT